MHLNIYWAMPNTTPQQPIVFRFHNLQAAASAADLSRIGQLDDRLAGWYLAGFRWISCIPGAEGLQPVAAFAIGQYFRGRGFAACGSLCHRAAALKERRLQSSILQVWILGDLDAWRLGCWRLGSWSL